MATWFNTRNLPGPPCQQIMTLLLGATTPNALEASSVIDKALPVQLDQKLLAARFSQAPPLLANLNWLIESEPNAGTANYKMRLL